MKLKNMILIIPLITLSGFSFAQGELDVYRFSNQRNLGTAFSAGMAGATGSVGSDATSFSVNPAALSLYRFSEFTAGIFINQFAAENMYIGQETRSKRGSFNLSNLSFVNTNILFDRGREPSDEMVSYGFGFSYQRLAEFNRSIEFRGQNKRSSIVDDFWEQAQGYYIEDLPVIPYMAYLNYLLDEGNGSSEWIDIFPDFERSSIQTISREESGGMGEFSASGAMNYGNFIHLGIGLQYVRVRHNWVSIINELNDFFDETYDELEFLTDNQTRGGGFGIKLGAIVRPNDRFRLGYSFHSPIRLNLKDEFFYELYTRYHPESPMGGGAFLDFFQREPPLGNNIFESDRYLSEYTVVTPARNVFSASFVDGSFGLISADLEFVSYSNMNLAFDGVKDFRTNNLIQSSFRTATNLRIGTEILGDRDLRYRFGTSFIQNPISSSHSDFENFTSTWLFSGGIGLRKPKYSIDFAVNHVRNTEGYAPYYVNDDVLDYYVARNILRNNFFVITAAFVIE